jgi:hypothetical protein
MWTYISLEPIGPSLGSYSPPLLGKFRLSSNIGLSIFCTEIDEISSVVRKENDSEEISVERGLPISIVLAWGMPLVKLLEMEK